MPVIVFVLFVSAVLVVGCVCISCVRVRVCVRISSVGACVRNSSDVNHE